MAHHYSTQTWYTQTHTYRERIMADLVLHKGSVFRQISIVELSALVLLGQFERIAQRHYVDYSASLSLPDAAALLRRRAQKKELSHDAYIEWEAATAARLRADGAKAD